MTVKKRWALFGLISLIIGSVFACLFYAPWETRWEGKRVSYWLDGSRLNDATKSEETYSLVKKLGTNAIPELIKALNREPSIRDRIIAKIPTALRKKIFPAKDEEQDLQFVISCLEKLGPEAKQAVPEMLTWFRKIF